MLAAPKVENTLVCASFESIRDSRDFSRIYKLGRAWHCEVAVVFYEAFAGRNFAVVASKKVGNAVQRNRAKRLLRAAFARCAPSLNSGRYIFVAKQNILNAEFSKTFKNVKWALGKLGCLK